MDNNDKGVSELWDKTRGITQTEWQRDNTMAKKKQVNTASLGDLQDCDKRSNIDVIRVLEREENMNLKKTEKNEA